MERQPTEMDRQNWEFVRQFEATAMRVERHSVMGYSFEIAPGKTRTVEAATLLEYIMEDGSMHRVCLDADGYVNMCSEWGSNPLHREDARAKVSRSVRGARRAWRDAPIQGSSGDPERRADLRNRVALVL